jgi:hypothetical protein
VKGRVHVRSTQVGQYDSKLEAEYAQRLDLLKRAGEIIEYHHKGIRLRIGASGESTSLAWYSPDFMVILPDGTIRLDEVKGRWMEAAKVRIRAAAEFYPYFHFLAIQKKRGSWELERFGVGFVGT